MELQEIANLKSEKKIRDELMDYMGSFPDPEDWEEQKNKIKSVDSKFIYVIMQDFTNRTGLFKNLKRHNIAFYIVKDFDFWLDKVSDDDLEKFLLSKKTIKLGDKRPIFVTDPVRYLGIRIANKFDIDTIITILGKSHNDHYLTRAMGNTIYNNDYNNFKKFFINLIYGDNQSNIAGNTLNELIKLSDKQIDEIIEETLENYNDTDNAGKFKAIFATLFSFLDDHRDGYLEFEKIGKIRDFIDKKAQANEKLKSEKGQLETLEYFADRTTTKTIATIDDLLGPYSKYVRPETVKQSVLNNVDKALKNNIDLQKYINLSSEKYIYLTDPKIVQYILKENDKEKLIEVIGSNLVNYEVAKEIDKIGILRDESKLRFFSTNSSCSISEFKSLGISLTDLRSKSNLVRDDVFIVNIMNAHTFEGYIEKFNIFDTKEDIKTLLQKVSEFKGQSDGIDTQKKKNHANKILTLFNRG